MGAKIITLTGIDGCGKSLQFEKLCQWFEKKDIHMRLFAFLQEKEKIIVYTMR